MSVLRNLEAKIESLVQGAFSRAFKSQVQPVELARKLVREMEEHKSVSVSRVYVPNEYFVFLSPDDREQFTGYESALKKELSDYLLEHARKEGLALVTRPAINFETDGRLRVGEFGIQAQLVTASDEEPEQPAQGDFGRTMVYGGDREERSMPPAPTGGYIRAMLVGDGKRTVLSGERVVLGRSRECDIVLDDPNISRQHAEVRREGETWMVADLGSTNGVKVNGRRVDSAALEPGDELTLGLVRLSFEVE
jgi:Protein of unknown function (DUF3662)/Inner membrane component of T3SS, cytoplasmic domain